MRATRRRDMGGTTYFDIGSTTYFLAPGGTTTQTDQQRRLPFFTSLWRKLGFVGKLAGKKWLRLGLGGSFWGSANSLLGSVRSLSGF